MPKGSGGYYLGKKHEEQGTFLMKPGMTFKKVKAELPLNQFTENQ